MELLVNTNYKIDANRFPGQQSAPKQIPFPFC